VSGVLDILIYNAIAFGIELILLLLIIYVGLTLILRLSSRIATWSFLKIDDETKKTWGQRAKRRSHILAAIVGLLLVICNLVLSFLKINTFSAGRTYLASISLSDLIPIGIGLGKVVGIICAALILNWILQKSLKSGHTYLHKAKFLQKRNDEVDELTDRFKILVKYLVMAGALLLSAYILGISQTWQSYLRFLAFGIVAFYGSRLIVQVVHLTIDVLFSFSGKLAQVESPLKYLGGLQHLLPLTKRAIEYFIYVGAATLVFSQVTARLAKLGAITVRVIAIFFISRVVIEVCRLFINEFFLAPAAEDDSETNRQAKQRQTLAPLVLSVLRYSVYFAALVMVLREAGIDPMPLLAGAGILGIAIGLGAQTFIMDIVSGVFIIFENLFFVGDFIECAGVEGYVEEVGIRISRIRDRAGKLHSIPNGEIRKVASHSKEFVNAVVDVNIAYEANIEDAVRVLEELGEQLDNDNPNVLSPTSVVGILEFGGSEVVLRTSTQVKPAMDFQVANELRRRIKEKFDKENIEIPYARRVIIFKRDEEESAAMETDDQQIHKPLPEAMKPTDSSHDVDQD